MKKLIIVLISILFTSGLFAQSNQKYFVDGVKNPMVSLNGTWKVNVAPKENFCQEIKLDESWKDVQVPGEIMMQGFPIKHNIPFAYKKEISIPADFKNKKIILRFEGVYSYARVWIDGKFIREHHGGFTTWECNITENVIPGKTAMLTVEVTDRADEISYASGYAKHQIGGILRSVNLMALPKNYPDQIAIVTELDENYTNSTLSVEGKIIGEVKDSKIQLELFDSKNKKVSLANSSLSLTENKFALTNQITNPLRWDAEHPNLYHLKISYVENGKAVYYKSIPFGFREVEIKGNKFLVNGKLAKLRGVCRHDVHPLLGRVSTPDYELKDVQLLKEANVNFVRTSHYPPTENFLSLCDQYGIFVEDETAVCFVGSHRTAEYYPGSSESHADFTERYLGQLQEMVYNHRNHPSIIMWSIGNENQFGTNFTKSFDWVKATDKTRPVIFSYPGLVPDSVKAYEVLSLHYPGTDGTMDQYKIKTKNFGNEKIPAIFDEWAHVACYNNFSVREDPNVRDFWGRSLDMMWQGVYDADGGLGGAIWGMIDETFMMPDNVPGFNEWWGKVDKKVIPAEYKGKTVGYGEWGIIDTWRRKKPEFWNVKKAYSPIRILQEEFLDYKAGSSLQVPIYNRYDFTNLNELTIKFTVDGKTSKLAAQNIAAHTKGVIELPIKNWQSGKTIALDFYDQTGMLVDSYLLKNAKQNFVEQENAKEKIELTDEANQYRIKCGNGITLFVDKQTGLFTKYDDGKSETKFVGPAINFRTRGKEVIYSSFLMNEHAADWKAKEVLVSKKENFVEVHTKGEYALLKDVVFTTKVFASGKIETTFDYSYPNFPKEVIREVGVKFLLGESFDQLSWKRNGYWSVYPKDHLSANEGKTPLYIANLNTYRTAPKKEWQYDAKSFYYFGIANEENGMLSNIARSTKENIFEFSLHKKSNGKISVISNGSETCRLEKQNNELHLFISNDYDYPDLSWGNFQKDIFVKEKYSGKATIMINK